MEIKWKTTFTVVLTIFLFCLPEVVLGQQTEVMIRAHSKDAKFIGSSIGGAKIIVRNTATGEILAEGMTEGSTGDTEKIMKKPHRRGQSLTDEKTAGFLAKLDIDKPTFVTVEVIAPFHKKQARVTSSTQLWVLPGKNITGDGLVLEVPGFVVDILSPQTHERISSDKEIEIKGNVVMMCGCPLTSDGIWDADQYEVKAIISSNGQSRTVDLEVGEKTSTFSGKVKLSPGNYLVTMYAFDPATGNTGVDKTAIIVQ